MAEEFPRELYATAGGSIPIDVYRVWLRDRKDRELTYDDNQHYERIISAARETLDLLDDVDAIGEKYGGWPF